MGSGLPGINTWTDYYGDASMGASGMGQATSALGPNQSIVTGLGQSPVMASSGKAAAFSWLGMMMLLGALYLVIQLGSRLSSVA